MATQKIYFPGLNGIRTIAAFSVMFFHITHASTAWFGIASETNLAPRLWLNGADAVRLFFVLSGFLITYLILVEQRDSGTIQVRKFYMRRVLRIWPLYYLLIFIGFVAIPIVEKIAGTPLQTAFYDLPIAKIVPKLIMYGLFLPNIGLTFGQIVIGIDHLWSVGVEEQFYFLWPLIVRMFQRRLLTVLLAVIVVKFSLIVLELLLTPLTTTPKIILDVLAVINFTSVENMAIGGIGAYLLFHKKQSALDVIYHPITEKIVLGVMFLALFVDFSSGQNWLGKFLLPIVFVIFILNICTNPRSALKLENRVFNMLGRISYGLYMYHVAILYVLGIIFTQTAFGKSLHLKSMTSLYIIVPLLTILVAQLSYQCFEQPFLKIKQGFTVITSSSSPDDKKSRSSNLVLQPEHTVR